MIFPNRDLSDEDQRQVIQLNVIEQKEVLDIIMDQMAARDSKALHYEATCVLERVEFSRSSQAIKRMEETTNWEG